MSLPGARQPAYQVVDPATGEMIRSFPYATDTEVAEILGASQATYLGWRERTVAERADLVRRAGAALVRRSRELAATMRLEMGKPLRGGRRDRVLRVDLRLLRGPRPRTARGRGACDPW